MSLLPSQPPPAPAHDPVPDSNFFDCRLTRGEGWILVYTLISAMALQCEPVLKSVFAYPLIIAMAILGWLSPFSGMFYIACAQSLPFPEHAPFNPAQLGVLTWLVVALLRYRGLRFHGIKHLLVYLPFLLWMELLWDDPIPVFSLKSEYAKAIMYMVIACQLINESKGRHLKSLMGLCLGALMVTNAYWGAALGLPIQLSDWGGARQEFTRLGGARADSIMVWPPTLMGAFGIVGIAFSVLTRAPSRQTSVLKWLACAVFLLSLPPLLGTMSNAAYLGWSLMLGWTLWLMHILHIRGRLPIQLARNVVGALLMFACAMVICYQTDTLNIRSRMHALKITYAEQSEEFGLAASRSLDWQYSIKSIASHPVTGRAFAEDTEEAPPGYLPSMPGEHMGNFFSHNVFLDIGRQTGLPGAAMLLIFFFYPLVRLWRRRQFDRYMAFMLAHFALTLFWMVLSFPFYKTFWAFWILACIAGDPIPPPARTLRAAS